MIFVLSEMCCRAEDVYKLRALAYAQFSTHRMAPGWRGCRIGFDLSTTGRMMLFEQWASASAFHRHLQSGRAISFANAIERLLVRPDIPRLVQTVGSGDLDVFDTAATEFMIYQARSRHADTTDARETLLAVDAMFRTCPGYLASHLAEDIFEPGCFFGVSEWREPRDAKTATVEPELLRLTVAAAPLFRDPLRFRLLNTVAVEHLDIPRRSLAEHLDDVFD
jgi:quinol monooxygenase YgiN